MKTAVSFLILCLLASLLASCSLMQTPTSIPQPKPFRILAYATDAIVESIIPYNQLTDINYSFLIPNNDGTFTPLNNAWKLKKIIETAHSQNVRVSVAVGGWGWDEQFEQMAANPSSRVAFVKNLKDVVV